jgi:hypothetical protein
MRSVEVARRLNLHCLSLIARVMCADDALLCLDVTDQHRDRWSRFDKRACERAAQIPIVLLDCHFTEAEWWCRVAGSGRSDSVKLQERPFLSSSDAAPLLREILVEGRTIAISEPRAASLVLGAPSDTVRTIASLSSTRIDEISVVCADELRPRWADNTVFWAKLLDAAIGDDDDALSEVSFHSLQLLGGGFVNPASGAATRSSRKKP